MTGLLVSGMSLSLPLLADMAKSSQWEDEKFPLLEEKVPLLMEGMPDSPASNDSQANTSSEDTLRFTLQHRFNGGQPLEKELIEIPFDKLESNPQIFLESIRKNFSKHLVKQEKPVTIDTKLELVLPAKMTEVLGQLPPVSVSTQIKRDGAGTSHVVWPAYRREVPEKVGKGLIDWKGLNAQFTFTDKFANMTAGLNLAGFTVTKEQDFTASLGHTTFQGTFDANWQPTEMNLNLPSFQMRQEGEGQMNLQTVTANFDANKTSKGLELGKIALNIGHFDFSDEEVEMSFDNLGISSNGQEQNDVVNYTVQTQIGKLELPKELTFGEKLAIGFVGNINFDRLDAESLLALQTTAHQLQEKEEPMMLMILFGQFMELVPKMMAKSPEIALTQLTINTPKGDLQGNFNVSLDGQKATSLEILALIPALLAQTNFTISRQLLEYVLTTIKTNKMQQELEVMGEKLSEADLAQLQQQAKTASLQEISIFVAFNWLINDGDNYKLAAEFKNGQFSLNGQEMSLPIGDMLAAPDEEKPAQ